jgi:molecular chaperone IbpA
MIHPETNPHDPWGKQWVPTKKVAAPKVITIDDLFPRIERWGIGWEPVLQSLRTVAKAEPNYPPYNIVKDGDKYEIVMAVAGFKKDQINVELTGRDLVVSNAVDIEKADIRDLIHQGIASRNFKVTFSLAEHVEVKSAKLADGLLTIKLKMELPEEKKPKTIEIE